MNERLFRGLTSSRARAILAVSKALFTPLALVFIAYFLWQSRTTLLSLFAGATHVAFCAVVLIWAGLHFISPVFTNRAFSACNMDITYPQALAIHIQRLPLKYLPGGIWNSVGRAGDYYALGIGAGQLARYLLLENMMLVAVTMALGGALLGSTTAATRSPMLQGLSIAILAALILFPLMGRHTSKAHFITSRADYYLALASLWIYWAGAGLAFVLYLGAFPDLQIENGPVETAGAYIVSWAVGYLALFAPQGLGISETVSSYLLESNLSLAALATLLLGFRVLMLLSDLLLWLAYLAIRKGAT